MLEANEKGNDRVGVRNVDSKPDCSRIACLDQRLQDSWEDLDVMAKSCHRKNVGMKFRHQESKYSILPRVCRFGSNKLPVRSCKVTRLPIELVVNGRKSFES